MSDLFYSLFYWSHAWQLWHLLIFSSLFRETGRMRSKCRQRGHEYAHAIHRPTRFRRLLVFRHFLRRNQDESKGQNRSRFVQSRLFLTTIVSFAKYVNFISFVGRPSEQNSCFNWRLSLLYLFLLLFFFL